ncbi:universal stress protein [Sphingomonas lacunae]|uniref:Universal stress protein n=1 Tax=Sphingomonas lacunae TaxID=2698828 RepID=A0A6M4AWI0_9SPHN|nr:universal stress protein [Sphingomonas lacunae]QJQ33106.1 universal stress protein [Sphingomonas lacunae]
MRTYLVVVDDSNEARLAQRFAARRAQRTGGNVHLVAVTEPSQFVAWGGVQATIEDEAREKAEAVVKAAANALASAHAIMPRVSVRQGDAASIVREIISEDSEIAALVLGAAASGPPGPLVAHFTGHDSGSLPVTVMIVPGSLSEAEVDRLSE